MVVPVRRLALILNDNLGTGVFGYFENVTYWSC
jgi:hypothetical protein